MENLSLERTEGHSFFVHRINSADEISFVDDNWIAFARTNWMSSFSPEQVLGQSIWDYISGSSNLNLYKLLLKKVRNSQLPVEFSYRCDSPETRRFLEMRIVPIPNGDVEFSSRIIREESREPVHLPPATNSDPEHMLAICSWCKKIRVPPWADSNVRKNGEEEWIDLEEALARLKLFELPFSPAVSHGVCTACFAIVMAQIEQ